jgi:hypothetical protein
MGGYHPGTGYGLWEDIIPERDAGNGRISSRNGIQAMGGYIPERDTGNGRIYPGTGYGQWEDIIPEWDTGNGRISSRNGMHDKAKG